MWYSSTYLRLLNIQPRYRYIYTLLTCIIFLGGWIFFWYQPIEAKIVQANQEIKQLKGDNNQLIEQKESCKTLFTQIEQLQQDANLIYDELSSQADYASLFMQCIRDADVQLVSLRAVDQKKCEWYTSAHFTIDAAGALSAVHAFFKLLIDRHIFVQCDQLSLQRKPDNTFLLHCVLRRMLPHAA